MTLYDAAFFNSIDRGAARSAAIVVPLLVSRLGQPATVVDVGCGSGAWSRAFADAGAKVVSIDGEENPVEGVIKRDLSQRGSIGDIHSDWAVCLEVAEHLPPERGPSFVEELCQTAPIVVFSAAIPGQGGTGHINCRPPGYWAGLFEDNGFVGSGALRLLIWEDEDIESWYRQNLLVFWRSGGLRPGLEPDDCHHFIHPDL